MGFALGAVLAGILARGRGVTDVAVPPRWWAAALTVDKRAIEVPQE